jgi:type IV secretion/conjugal transfer VirB4 family ATPase
MFTLPSSAFYCGFRALRYSSDWRNRSADVKSVCSPRSSSKVLSGKRSSECSTARSSTAAVSADLLNLSEFRPKAKGFADLLNYAAVVADGIVLNKDGSLMAAWSYRGEDLDSASSGDLAALSARVNAIFARFASGWMMHVDAIRSPAFGYPETAEFPDRTTRLIDDERRIQYGVAGARFESVYVLTVTYLPPVDATEKLGYLFVDNKEFGLSQPAARVLATFKHAIRDLEDGLSSCLRLRRLRQRVICAGGGIRIDDELLAYLNTCITGQDHSITLPPVPMYLDSLLGGHDFYGDLRPRLGRTHIRAVSIVGYPQSSHPGILDLLHRLPLSYRWSSRFIFVDPTIAESQIAGYEKKWFARRKSLRTLIAEHSGSGAGPVNAHADAMASDAQSALAESSSGVVKYGFFTSVVIIMDDDPVAADSRAGEVRKSINNAGFNARVEDVNAVEAYLGSLPGHGVANVRRPLMHSLNVADLLPLTAVWSGPTIHPCPYYPVESSPLANAATAGATPFRLSLHVSDVGHTLVLGPTGSGKSTLLGFLIAQQFRYPRAQVFAFDKGLSAFVLCAASGGEHYDIAGDQGGLSFYPLANIHLEAERAWAADWLESLAILQGMQVRPRHRQALARALELLGQSSQRTLTDLVSTLQDHELRDALAHYTLAGAMGSLLDADADGLGTSDFQVFEIGNLMGLGPKNVAPVLLYLFHRIEQRLQGQPTLIVLDEAWLMLLNDLFESKIRDWLKTLRKSNAAVVFATHSPVDVLNSPIASTILDSCPTKILLPNPDAASPALAPVYKALGLTSKQMEIIAGATPKRHYYYISPNGRRLFALDLGDAAMSFIGASGKDDISVVRALMSEQGQRWPAAWLRSRGLDNAAQSWLQYLNRSSPASPSPRDCSNED